MIAHILAAAMVADPLMTCEEQIRAEFDRREWGEPPALVAWVYAASDAQRATGVSASLLLTLAAHESRFRFGLVGDAGEAHGPWQIHPEYMAAVQSGRMTYGAACEYVDTLHGGAMTAAEYIRAQGLCGYMGASDCGSRAVAARWDMAGRLAARGCDSVVRP